MIDIQLNGDGHPDWVFIKISDLDAGKRIVYLGGNVERLDSEVKSDFNQHVFPDNLSEKLSKSTMPATMFFQEGIEDLINHEVCHILIHDLTGSHSANRGLDRMDFMCKDVYDILIVCDEVRGGEIE